MPSITRKMACRIVGSLLLKRCPVRGFAAAAKATPPVAPQLPKLNFDNLLQHKKFNWDPELEKKAVSRTRGLIVVSLTFSCHSRS